MSGILVATAGLSSAAEPNCLYFAYAGFQNACFTVHVMDDFYTISLENVFKKERARCDKVLVVFG